MPMARYELDDHFGSRATQIAVGHNCPSHTEVLGPLGGNLGASCQRASVLQWFRYVHGLNIKLDVHTMNKVLVSPRGVGDAAGGAQRRIR
jgi:hypothetical protein